MALLDCPVASNGLPDTSDPLRVRFSAFIAHNDFVPGEITAELKLALVQPRRDLEDTQRTVKILSLALEALQRKCSDLQQKIATYEPIFSPMRRLPDDMLREIFIHCLPTHRNPIPITSECPLLLTLVCRKWRDVALRTPRMWSRLHISFEFNPYLDMADTSPVWPLRVTGLNNWLTRSGALPISLSLYCDSDVYGGTDVFAPTFAREVLLIVKQHARRLAFLEMCLSHGMFNMMQAIIDIRADIFPLLKYIRHCSKYGPSSSMVPADPVLLSHWVAIPTLEAIALATLSDDRYISRMSMNAPLLHWPPSLTQLSLHAPCGRQLLLGILKQCNLLEECTITVYNDIGWNWDTAAYPDAEPQPVPSDKVVLPHLTKLIISGQQKAAEDLCGGGLEAPALTHFLYYPSHPVGWALTPSELESNQVPQPTCTPLLAFLSHCDQLNTLTLNSSRIGPANFLAILEATPMVTALSLDHGISDTKRINYTDNSRPEPSDDDYNLYPLLKQEYRSISPDLAIPLNKPLLPNLKSFTLYSRLQDTGTDRYDELLIDFCNKRIHANPPSRSTNDDSTNTTVDAESTAPVTTTASLEYVMITLDGLVDVDLVDPELDFIAVDIERDIEKHVESVGKVVGKDVVLDIAYPWTKMPHPSLPPKIGPISLKEGLDDRTDHTWHFFD